ncbi:MAG TPA: sigma 54-interacting transcriptional regulator [Pyrinomonadaceae bacterium]|jgi:transcriptional regulator with GAF, ATPase, and Fis domain/Tfp pilus assembly protein PilF|nr:sigma 54-interacting transcriptional regulator [Pyrinomonadaceae bacterium]
MIGRRTRTGRDETGKDAPSARDAGVVHLADARLRSRKAATRESLIGEMEEIRLLLDQGRSTEVQSRITQLIVAARQDASLLAQARCALSMALEMQGRYRESLEAVLMYETPEAHARIDAETSTRLRVQIGLAYNYTGDHPKAIALLNAALREASESGANTQMGAIYVALARIYRSINEYPIAHDYAQRALEHYRNSGDWRGLAESYFAIAVADMLEGNYEAALDNNEQALKLVGDYHAPYLLAKIYNNMAGVCWFLKRPQEGIRNLEKSISYYERTEHKANAADGYNNLGINLILVGEWKRAQAALERALALASEVNENSPKLSMPLDSLGELHMLRGDLVTAQSYLERAVALATSHGNKWYSGQTLRTLGRCLLAMNDPAEARENGRQALAFAEAIADRQAICESRLLLAEASLMCGNLEECAAELQAVAELTTDSVTDLGFAGEAQRLNGLLALEREDAALAAQHFSRSVTIFDILGDRYRGARAHYELGRAYASAQPERAAEHLSRAAHTFRELGARLDLSRAEEALAALDRNAPELHDERSALTQLLTLRLAEAVASRELLLRELAAVVHQETDARRVLIVEPGEDKQLRVVVTHGFTTEEAARSAAELGRAQSQSEREALSAKHDAAIIPLRATNAPPAILFIAPRTAAVLPGGIAIEPLLRVVELGMDVCALRAGAQSGRSTQEDGALTGASLMPGFIHSSPAMTRLVEEVHKIRSSDVTVLVTGESGTGKELVARAIHALSSRRSKVFVPFNCTAVPKELSEGYLFGYRRGAFTGAVADSPGVIRTAEGGTLFLDEIGDLPLDVQPKLLRFLQEGEIQPLGEQRPVKVDVRIIAATNSDLEEMVAGGRFREDLYYRLNVIRLRVPPLRERRSEIPTIVNYYINHYSAKFGRRDIEITPQAVDLLMVCDWPGNVRQLTNEIQRVVARAEDGTLITPDHLSPELRRTSSSITPPALVTPINAAAATPPEGTTLADALADLERRMIAEVMRKHGGNISRAARELGLTRRGLYLKLERHDMTASA